MRTTMIAVALVLTALGARAAERCFHVDPAASVLRVHVGKAGLFKFAGHEHEVVAAAFQGQVRADEADLARSSVALSFEAAALRVTGEGEPPEDVPKVQEAMVGPKLLDVARFPTIAFRSTHVRGRVVGPGAYQLEVAGELELRGVKRPLTLPMRVELAGDTLTASGAATLRHTDFGLKPISVAGVVKVKNEIAIDYNIVAKAAP